MKPWTEFQGSGAIGREGRHKVSGKVCCQADHWKLIWQTTVRLRVNLKAYRNTYSLAMSGGSPSTGSNWRWVYSMLAGQSWGVLLTVLTFHLWGIGWTHHQSFIGIFWREVSVTVKCLTVNVFNTIKYERVYCESKTAKFWMLMSTVPVPVQRTLAILSTPFFTQRRMLLGLDVTFSLKNSGYFIVWHNKVSYFRGLSHYTVISGVSTCNICDVPVTGPGIVLSPQFVPRLNKGKMSFSPPLRQLDTWSLLVLIMNAYQLCYFFSRSRLPCM